MLHSVAPSRMPAEIASTSTYEYIDDSNYGRVSKRAMLQKKARRKVSLRKRPNYLRARTPLPLGMKMRTRKRVVRIARRKRWG